MVQTRSRRRLYFIAFVLPALALYGLFFAYPFGRGIAISFTNWDGLTPRSPISMEKAEFEARILSRVTEADRAFLAGVYSYDEHDGAYHRLALRGATRNRVEAILRRAGYEPETYKRIGLKNYRDILSGGVDARFYPRRFTKKNYNEDAELPRRIDRREYEAVFLAKTTEEERSLAETFYRRDGESYALLPERDQFELEDRIWLLPEVETEKTVDSGAVDRFISAIKGAGLEKDHATAKRIVSEFLTEHRLSERSSFEVKAAAEGLFALGEFKRILATRWVESKLDLGVIGFTVFFALTTVVGANLLAFLIALALDTKIRSRNVLRSVFFLPNVLSMVVVALIWSIVFSQLLPRITGIEKWMGDPNKAPWLVSAVAVWQMAGYYMVIYLAGLQNIPADVLEAAMIDGAGPWQRLRNVTLPLLVPAITVCLFLSTANALKCFDLVYALSGPSGYALGTVPFVMDIFFDAFAKKLAGLATAKATLLFLVILAITGIQLVIMKRKELDA